MSDTVIQVENLWKEYRLGLINHHTLTRDLQSWWAKVRGKEDPNSPIGSGAFQFEDRFWALQDVSFEVKQGDILGIIGRNGAGKSTLLKILSQVTAPTKGEVRFNGRIASLLEVGTGFHPELTGRENIFLNGAILGMGRAEIRKKFDEIVDFAEIEKFLDTPVKRYSSGMYVRLAFAVAAHLEPEILIVDEVLAVGDAQFQKKCLGKMENVGKEGRTVLFVSHNMQAIRQLCDRAVLLRSGALVLDGEGPAVVEGYLREVSGYDETRCIEEIIRNLPADPAFRLEVISLKQNGHPIGLCVESGKPLEVEIKYSVLERTTGLRVYFDLCDDQDTILFRSFHDESSEGIPVVESGIYSSKAIIPSDILGPLRYKLRIRATIHNQRCCVPPEGLCVPITVEMTGNYNRAYLSDTFRGKLGFHINWVTNDIT